ncbi:uncharacterized protein LOC114270722 [Camellia sinensis]|uniref:uncharacterized protein LOC114270722 n=1 Tax=Camellia sinensis TaxID=4442 RepID=UPI0010359B1E|nr:uncharacterized protein LOC114270722 [Camellia sinensis]
MTIMELFWAHPVSLDLLRSFPKVIVIDRELALMNAIDRVYRTRTATTYSYVDALPVGLKPYIRLIKDVDTDRNCGFRAITGLMELTEAEWGQVRCDLLKELHTHKVHYTQLYGSHDKIEELTHILSYFEPNPGYDRWMTMPDMGHPIASCYNVVLYHLSAQQCLTFLPLRSVPISQVQWREIAIRFVNGIHFVQVFMLPGHPVPLIATNWCRFHHSCAAGCNSAYSRRIKHFKEVVHSRVAIRETFDCINLDE